MGNSYQLSIINYQLGEKMSYSEFTLEKVKKDFNLTTFTQRNIFANIAELSCTELLTETLEYNLPIALASNNEKARSELIIAPILVDLIRKFNQKINLFSGVEFNVDIDKGLNGNCDFLITNSPELLLITEPVIIIVEAKKENINAGLGQCVAEMIAARIFNQQKNNNITTIYGTVTTGSIWQFLKLEDQIINIDVSEYYLKDVNKILGILASAINNG